jgi:hypothetical protein
VLKQRRKIQDLSSISNETKWQELKDAFPEYVAILDELQKQ